MPSRLIMRVGVSVFGLAWESDMAITRDVSEDELRRWVRGEEPPRVGLYAELAVFVAERQEAFSGSPRS